MARALVHLPLRPARKAHPEAEYLAAWRDFVARDDEVLDEVFGRLPFRFGQRAARVAASFATWLGTNSGASFLHDAKREAAQARNQDDAYLRAWAHQNRRLRWLNSGVRTIEWMLAPEPCGTREYELTRAVLTKASRTITMADMDVIEAMVAWLPEPSAQIFLDDASARVEGVRQAERRRQLLQHNWRMGLPLPADLVLHPVFEETP